MTRRRALALPALLVALLALVLVALAEAGTGGGRIAGATALAIAALAFALFSGARRDRSGSGRPAGPRPVDATLAALFDELAAADYVRAREAAGALPDALGAAAGDALATLDSQARTLQRASVFVARSATGVQRIASELAAGSSEQAASVVEITAAMEELAQTATQIAGTAAAQADLAREGSAAGEGGVAAIEWAAAGVQRLQERIEATTRRAAELRGRAEEIAAVAALVDEIARETHLLSLSAAVEAAGEPGETGDRFADVAAEVRRLAAHARDAAASVRRLLEECGRAIEATAAATAYGGGEAAAVLVHARDAAGAIGGLRAALAEIATSAREISAGTAEQKTASSEVVQTLREAAEVVRRIAEELRGFSGAATGLEEAAIGVQLLAQRFRVASPASLRQLAELWAAEVMPLLASPQVLERHLEAMLEARSDIECVYVFDPRRTRVAIVAQRSVLAGRSIPDEVRSGKGFADRPWYRLALAERRSAVTPVFTSLLSNERVVTAVAPLAFFGDDAVVLGIDIHLERWSAG